MPSPQAWRRAAKDGKIPGTTTWKDLAQAAYKKQLAPKPVNPLREVKRWGSLEKRLASEQLERNVRGSVAISKLASKEKAAPKDGLSEDFSTSHSGSKKEKELLRKS